MVGILAVVQVPVPELFLGKQDAFISQIDIAPIIIHLIVTIKDTLLNQRMDSQNDRLIHLLLPSDNKGYTGFIDHDGVCFIHDGHMIRP